MKTVTAREIQSNLKGLLEEADQKQEVLCLPSTRSRGDFFLVPADVFNSMSSPRNYTRISVDEAMRHVEAISQKRRDLLNQLDE